MKMQFIATDPSGWDRCWIDEFRAAKGSQKKMAELAEEYIKQRGRGIKHLNEVLRQIGWRVI